MPRILIVASGKSGTTALYYTLLKSCPKPEPRGVFEPQTLDAFRRAAHLARTQVVLDLAERMPGIFTFRYEDMVAGRFEHLESFLGFAVLRDVEVAPEVDRVVRTKGSGGWRHWFTPEDLEWVRADFGPLVRRMGYDDGDWALAPSPEIRPEHASGYVRRILAQKRALQTPSSPPNKV